MSLWISRWTIASDFIQNMYHKVWFDKKFIFVRQVILNFCWKHVCHIEFAAESSSALRWRHNGRDSVSNHQPHDCLLNRLFKRRSKKTSKLRVTGLCAPRWIPRTNGQLRGKCFHLMTSSWKSGYTKPHCRNLKLKISQTGTSSDFCITEVIC